jgi:crossover junction endodeoxyribonuclease RusA
VDVPATETDVRETNAGCCGRCSGAGGMAGQEMTVTLPWPPKELSPNARIHWTKLAKAKKAYRHTCHMLARQAGFSAVYLVGVTRLHVSLTFYPPDRRLRDQDNMLAAMKSGLDGLADALQMDDRNFKTTFEVSDEIGGMVIVTVGVA